MASTSFNYNMCKKIKPIERPELVLKTPIAYHGGTDLSVIPIDKDGIAVCCKCGAIGVKHSFYTKRRNFCSLQCARSLGDELESSERMPKRQIGYRFEFADGAEHLVGMIPMEPLPQLPGMWQPVVDDFLHHARPRSGANSYDWHNDLLANDFEAAPVELFPHAPLAALWPGVAEGTKVEVKNRDRDGHPSRPNDYFWVATVLKVRGYMALLRYEGFGNDASKDFWENALGPDVHPVGWCATRGKPLIPPQSLGAKYSNWKAFLVQRLTGARSFPTDTYAKLSEGLKSRFRVGHTLEVVDKNRICQVRVATVREIVGKRLHVRYYGDEDGGFWCHEDCPLIHPVGWAKRVGHPIRAPPEYLARLEEGRAEPDDAAPDLFKYYTAKDPHNIGHVGPFPESTKLEAIDPLNLSSICVATVMKVLSYGYIMIRIDCYPSDESGSDWFCYHENSPYIFPEGFCRRRGIPLTVAIGQPPAPTSPPNAHFPDGFKHGFVPGMRLECVDLMDPRLVCVATIAGVVGRLLKVHFNGWGEEYDQWLDCESTDIYPVGWCQVVGHKLEGPYGPTRQPAIAPKKRGRKKKGAKTSTQTDTHKSSQSRSFADTLCDISNSNDGVYDMMPSTKMEVTMDDDDKVDVPNDYLNSEQPDMADHLDFDLPIEKHEMESENKSFDTLDIEPIKSPVPSPPKEEETRVPKLIPRLVGVPIDLKAMESIDPESWDTEDVAQFLAINDCAPYCSNFNQITGKTMLELTKDEIIELLQMKVGPSLKIYDLIGQLKAKLKPIFARNKQKK